MNRPIRRWRRRAPVDDYERTLVGGGMRFRVGRPWWTGLDPYAIVVAVLGVLLLATRQDRTVPYTGLGLQPAQLIGGVLALLWVVSRLVGQRQPARLGVLTGLIAVRAALLLVSFGLASGRLLTDGQRAASDRLMLVELGAGVVVVVLATVLRTARDVEFVLRALVVGGAVSGGYAVIQYATGVDLARRIRLPGLTEAVTTTQQALLREGVVRSRGAASVPLELGAVTAVLIPLAVALFFAARGRGERSWPWAVAVLLLAGGGVVSLSRSVFLAAGVGLLLMMPRWPVRRVLGILAAVAVVIGVALASGARIVDAVVTVFTQGSDDYSLGSRSDGRAYVWAQFAHHFWFGQGPGTYDQGTQPVLDNQYLSQLMETGTIGLIAFVLVLLGALAYALRATARSVPQDCAELAGGIAGAIAALIIINAVLDTAGFVQVFTLQWLLVGLAAAIFVVNVRGPGPALVGRRVTAERPAVAAR